MSRYLCFAVVACGVLCCQAQPSREPTRLEAEYYVAVYAQHYGVPVGFVRAIVQQESGWRPCAVSRKGAVGLMQLMPSTAARLGVRDLCNLNENVSGGVLYLAWLTQRFQGDLRLVAAGYITGEDVVRRRGLAYHNTEVVTYVSRIRANCRPQLADRRPANPAPVRSRVIQ
ncbi:MAG: lytic transglycosylase domain-containing protein [Candidatus Sulfotelmatobacter sp.]